MPTKNTLEMSEYTRLSEIIRMYSIDLPECEFVRTLVECELRLTVRCDLDI